MGWTPSSLFNSLFLLQNDLRESYGQLTMSPAAEKPPVCHKALLSRASGKGQASPQPLDLLLSSVTICDYPRRNEAGRQVIIKVMSD